MKWWWIGRESEKLKASADRQTLFECLVLGYRVSTAMAFGA